jgi:hypothetical protein
MCYSLKNILDQSLNDDHAVDLSGVGYTSRILSGVKIIKDHETGLIQILNTHLNGDYYGVITSIEKCYFMDHGWRFGVYNVSLSNYRTILTKIERIIKLEANNKNRLKHISSYQEYRSEILSKYTKTTSKLNKLIIKLNGKNNKDNI